jgi:hypothetical protein
MSANMRILPAYFSNLIDNIEFQKTYLFYIHLNNFTVNLPNGVTFSMMPNEDEFELCTANTMFPVITTDVQKVGFYNSELKIATKNTYSDWSANFRLDINRQSFTFTSGGDSEKISTYEYFYIWQNLIFDPIHRTSLLPHQYKQNVELFLLNEKGEVDSSENGHFILEGVFPTQISGGTLDYSSEGILTYTVNFAYDRFTLESVMVFE